MQERPTRNRARPAGWPFRLAVGHPGRSAACASAGMPAQQQPGARSGRASGARWSQSDHRAASALGPAGRHLATGPTARSSSSALGAGRSSNGGHPSACVSASTVAALAALPLACTRRALIIRSGPVVQRRGAGPTRTATSGRALDSSTAWSWRSTSGARWRSTRRSTTSTGTEQTTGSRTSSSGPDAMAGACVTGASTAGRRTWPPRSSSAEAGRGRRG